MAEQAQDQQRHSTLDTANNAVRHMQSLAKNAKRLKRIAQGVRIAAAALSSGGGLVILIILLILAGLLLVILIAFFGGSSSNTGQICTTKTITTEGSGSAVALWPADKVRDVIKFGKNNRSGAWGTSQVFASKAQEDKIIDYYRRPFGSTQYRKLVGRGPVYLYFYAPQDPGNMGGGSWPPALAWSGLLYYLNRNTGNDSSDGMVAKTLIHELNHLIDARWSRISDGDTRYGGDKYRRASLVNNDPRCYDACPAGSRDYISTYANRDCTVDGDGNIVGGGANHESFAESVADYVFCKPGRLCDFSRTGHSKDIRFNDTNGDGWCHATYAWVKKNIFGGDDFFGAGGGSTTQTVTTCVAAPPPESAPQSTSCGSLTNPSEALFECLTKDQGRNVTALGSNTNDFIKNVKNNIGTRGWGLAKNDTYLAKIYNASLAYRVNPVMLVVIWGVESSWRLNGTEFGVLYKRGEGFDSQLSGAVWILDNWMKVFNQKQTNGSLVYTNTKNGVTCTHTFYDKFSYSYNKYTPICPPLYGNDPTRKNFINFYKVLKGI